MGALHATPAPNFHLINNSDRDLHFIVVGANDLLTLKNLQLESPTIVTLKPGEQHTEHISLKGNLEVRSPMIYLYPHPQGEQAVLDVSVAYNRAHIHTSLQGPMDNDRVYCLGYEKKIYVEWVLGQEKEEYGRGTRSPYYGLTLRSRANHEGVVFLSDGSVVERAVRDSDIIRGYDYEKLGDWARGHPDEFCAFLEKVLGPLYAYLRAGGVAAYLWRYGAGGARDILRVRRAKAKLERCVGVKL